MDNKVAVSESVREAIEKLKGKNGIIKPTENLIDTLLPVFRVIDKEVAPLYEKVKELSNICDKIDLIANTMERLQNYRTISEKAKPDSIYNIFR